MSTPAVYRPHPRYLLMIAVASICALALGWMLLRRFDWGAVIFLAFAAGLVIVALSSLFSRVEVEEQGIRLYRPLLPAVAIGFRQLSEVTEEGRLQRVILILYHPLRDDGLVELDDLRSQALPALEEQAELLELLQAKTPSARFTSTRSSF